MRPAFDISEEIRSETSQQAKDRVGTWSDDDIYKFKPERWLKKHSDDDGEREVFDHNAGPHMAFGHGPRSCFGRKLAYLETRIVVTLLVWKFEFLKAGGALDDLSPIDTFMVRPKRSYVKLREVSR
jgi:cytochrome P450